MGNTSTPAQNFASGCIALIIFFVIVPYACNSCFNSPEAKKAEEERKLYGFDAEAIVSSQMLIEKYLKAPSTADFPLPEVKGNKGYWRVKGVVDAQNSFGAKLRAEYDCILKYDRAVDKYDCMELIFDNKHLIKDGKPN